MYEGRPGAISRDAGIARDIVQLCMTAHSLSEHCDADFDEGRSYADAGGMEAGDARPSLEH